MRTNNAEYWNREYQQGSPHFKALSSDDPSIAALNFIKYLEDQQIPIVGKLLTVGCGMGRNELFLAEQGFNVTGIDISEAAVSEAIYRTQARNLDINFKVLDISQHWAFKDGHFPFVLDFVTSHLLNRQQLDSYKINLKRALRDGGMFVLYTLDRSRDEEAQKLLQERPGTEPNTYVLPEMGIQERAFTLEEIAQEFPFLTIEHSQLIHRPTRFVDHDYGRDFWWVVMRKNG